MKFDLDGKVKKTVQVSLPPEAMNALRSFANAEEFTSLASAASMIIQTALSGSPIDASIKHARLEALREARQYCFSSSIKFFKELATLMENEIK